MQESYGEGVAIHADPELCVASREAGGETLAGARAGRVMSPESTVVGSADAVPLSGRQHAGQRKRELVETPRGRRPRARTEPSHGGPGDPRFLQQVQAGRTLERSGKAEAARR